MSELRGHLEALQSAREFMLIKIERGEAKRIKCIRELLGSLIEPLVFLYGHHM